MVRSRLNAVIKRITQSRILRSSSAMMVSNIASTGILLLLSVFLTRELGANDYGLMVLATTIVKGVMKFLDIRSDSAIVKFMGEAVIKGQKREAVTFFYVGFIADAVIMLATLAVLLISMPVISNIYGDNLLLMSLVKISMLSLPLSLLDNIFSTMLVVFKRYALLATLTFVNNLVQVICVVSLAANGGVESAMWGYVVASVIVFIEQVGLGVFVLYENLGTFQGKDFRSVWRQLLPFIFHTNLAGYLKAVVANVDILLLGVFRPSAEVSYYKLAKSACRLIPIPISPVATVIYPHLNEAWAQDNLKRAQNLIGRYLTYTLGITLAAAVGVFLIADPVVLLIYGPEFSPVGDLMRIYCFAIVFGQLSAIGQPVMFAKGKPAYNTMQKLESALVELAACLILIPILGAVGAAISSLITVVVITAILFLITFPALGVWKTPWTKTSATNLPQ